MSIILRILNAIRLFFVFIYRKVGILGVLILLFVVECIIMRNYGLSRIITALDASQYSAEVIEDLRFAEIDEIKKELSYEFEKNDEYAADVWKDGGYRAVIRIHNIGTSKMWSVPYLDAKPVGISRHNIFMYYEDEYYSDEINKNYILRTQLPPGAYTDVVVYIENNKYFLDGVEQLEIYSDYEGEHVEGKAILNLPAK